MTVTGGIELICPSVKAKPVLFGIPHSGRFYPDDMRPALPPHILRQAEDAYVDRLLAGAETAGVTVLRALFARAYLDVNREEDDLDPLLFPPGTNVVAGPKSKMGIGLVRRIVRPGVPIYDRFLTCEEVAARIETCHRPYHAALNKALSDLRNRFGRVVFIDWHSMKSVGNAATPDGNGAVRPDFVVGDRKGTSCHPALTELVRDELQTRGYAVNVNDPYQGTTVLGRIGNPAGGVHALQIEINRSLYLNEETWAVKPTFETLGTTLRGLWAPLAAWALEGKP